jgi:hypothetical protein
MSSHKTMRFTLIYTKDMPSGVQLFDNVSSPPNDCCIVHLEVLLFHLMWRFVSEVVHNFFKAKYVCRTNPSATTTTNGHRQTFTGFELSSSSCLATVKRIAASLDEDVLICINSNIVTKRTQVSSLLVAF